MKSIRSQEELTSLLGENLKKLRLQIGLHQEVLSKQAGISVSALKNLENGTGASVKTLIKVVRALNREDWLESIAPVISVNPLHMVQDVLGRQRAPRRAHGKNKKG